MKLGSGTAVAAVALVAAAFVGTNLVALGQEPQTPPLPPPIDGTTNLTPVTADPDATGTFWSLQGLLSPDTVPAAPLPFNPYPGLPLYAVTTPGFPHRIFALHWDSTNSAFLIHRLSGPAVTEDAKFAPIDLPTDHP
jgi:hypothetical protein